MKLVKHIFISALMIAFMFNATAGFATGICDGDHHDSQLIEIPCHAGEMAEFDQISPDDSKQEQKTAQCTMCKCGHCKSHSQMSLGHGFASPNVQANPFTISAHSDVIISSITYGIDAPPKQIS